MDPVSENDVAMCGLGGEAVIMQCLHFVKRQKFGEAKIQNGLHVTAAEILRHLVLSGVFHF